MLSKIYIQNFALIDILEIDLHSGFQVITGETGTGKSIILGALRLIMGERADSKSISDASRKSVVEGTFEIDEVKFNDFFKENDLDFEKETVVRRELTASGKSRAFINDVPVTLNILQDFSKRVIDIHSQFETSNLFDEAYQFSIVDGIAKNEKLLQQYSSEFTSYIDAKSELVRLEKRLSEGNKEADYNQYLYQELTGAHLDDINLDQLKSEIAAQENVQTIIEQLSQSYQLLQQDETGGLDIINLVKNKISSISEFSDIYQQLSDRLQSIYVELKDIESTCETELGKIEANPEILLDLNAKLNLINNLLLKHQVQTVDELIAIKNELGNEQNIFENLEYKIKERLASIEQQEKKLTDISKKISESRAKAAKIFVKKCNEVLKRLGLENAKLEIELSEDNSFNQFGKDNIQILFQANLGYPLKPIQTAVSGGERSRVMFAVKKIVAETNDLPTLILDEIDTGISGRIAEEMGILMKEMGKDLQLIVITHLAQVAAKGDNNYKVIKSEKNGKTQTTIKQLTSDEKLHEIAQLLSGSKVTEAAMLQATELIQS